MIAKKVSSLPPSGIRVFFDLVLGMEDVISLGVGEPDFVTPWNIREKVISSLEEGVTSYTSNKGLLRLRRELEVFLKKTYGLRYNAEREILITVGVSQALDLALRAILDPQDKVIVVRPSYVAYSADVELAGGQVLDLCTTQEEQFKINPAKLKVLLKQKPKAIILNYPANPTGVSYTKKELRILWEILRKEDTLIISDEVYDQLSFDFPHTPFAAFPGAREKTIYLGGFSKNYAMTGLRVGFACAPSPVIDAMTKIHSFVMLCAPITAQIGAVEALHSQKRVFDMMREYRRRRNFIVEKLNEIGMTTLPPQGAFYCFSSIKRSGFSSLDFASKLLKAEKVAVVPGNAFGQAYNDYVRISFAQEFDLLKEACMRIGRFLQRQ